MKLLSHRIQIQKKCNQKLETKGIPSYYSRRSGKTSKVTKALLVKCAPATGQRKYNGSQQQMLFYYTSQTELVDQWFGNILNKIETREKKN